MSDYTFIKLSEVTLIEEATKPNLLIEEGGEIKRIPCENVASKQVQADFNQTDETAPDFIKNKPVGGTVETYYFVSFNVLGKTKDGDPATPEEIYESWQKSDRMQVEYYASGELRGIYPIISVCYLISGDGSKHTRAYYLSDNGNNVNVCYV